MVINNYYRGTTDKLTGFVFDTESKTYKEYKLNADQWSKTVKGTREIYVVPRDSFVTPGDISYYFRTKEELKRQLEVIKSLGYKTDDGIRLDFGAFVL